MPTVTSLVIENPGEGYVSGTSQVTLNNQHGEDERLSNLYVDISVNGLGEVITANIVGGKTGLNFEVDDLVFVKPVLTTRKLAILRITSVQP